MSFNFDKINRYANTDWSTQYLGTDGLVYDKADIKKIGAKVDGVNLGFQNAREIVNGELLRNNTLLNTRLDVVELFLKAISSLNYLHDYVNYSSGTQRIEGSSIDDSKLQKMREYLLNKGKSPDAAVSDGAEKISKESPVRPKEDTAPKGTDNVPLKLKSRLPAEPTEVEKNEIPLKPAAQKSSEETKEQNEEAMKKLEELRQYLRQIVKKRPLEKPAETSPGTGATSSGVECVLSKEEMEKALRELMDAHRPVDEERREFTLRFPMDFVSEDKNKYFFDMGIKILVFIELYSKAKRDTSLYVVMGKEARKQISDSIKTVKQPLDQVKELQSKIEKQFEPILIVFREKLDSLYARSTKVVPTSTEGKNTLRIANDYIQETHYALDIKEYRIADFLLSRAEKYVTAAENQASKHFI